MSPVEYLFNTILMVGMVTATAAIVLRLIAILGHKKMCLLYVSRVRPHLRLIDHFVDNGHFTKEETIQNLEKLLLGKHLEALMTFGKYSNISPIDAFKACSYEDLQELADICANILVKGNLVYEDVNKYESLNSMNKCVMYANEIKEARD
jgi:hypothetical protein